MSNVISGIIPDDTETLVDAMIDGQNLKEKCTVELDLSLPLMGFRHTPGTTLIHFGQQLFVELCQDFKNGFFDRRIN